MFYRHFEFPELRPSLHNTTPDANSSAFWGSQKLHNTDDDPQLGFWHPELAARSCWAGAWRSMGDHNCGDDGAEGSSRSKRRVRLLRLCTLSGVFMLCLRRVPARCLAEGGRRRAPWRPDLPCPRRESGLANCPGDHPARWSASFPSSSGLTPRDGLRNDAPVSPVVPTGCKLMAWTNQAAHHAFHCRPRTPQGLRPHPGVNFPKSEKSGRPG